MHLFYMWGLQCRNRDPSIQPLINELREKQRKFIRLDPQNNHETKHYSNLSKRQCDYETYLHKKEGERRERREGKEEDEEELKEREREKKNKREHGMVRGEGESQEI